MADIAVTSEDVKGKVVEKNSLNVQVADRPRAETIPNEGKDTVSNTLHPPSNVISGQMMPPQVRKKTSSFQITSVTQSRLSHDGGEDSADDLDESHTEDLSSELIDCSKTTDIDNDGASSEDFSASTGVNNVEDVHGGVMFGGVSVSQGNVTIGVPVPILINAALSIATTNPTYVTPVPVNATAKSSPVVPDVTELVVERSDQQEQWENRFKVVKIVNGEPFRRGRWIIMDYNDSPPPPSAQPPENKAETTGDGAGSGNSSAGSSVQYVSGDNHPLENTTAIVHDSSQSNANTAVTQPSTYVNQTQPTQNQPPKTEYSNTNIFQSSSNAQSTVVQTSTLPNSNNQISSIQPSNNSALPLAPKTDPPTVIVQESNIVPTDQNNVPQINDHENIILQSTKQASTTSVVNQESPVLKPLLDSLPDTLGVSSKLDDVANGDEAESASGSNTVAIDNKIEQAMDLVKSHLMFAVREEVDVLREKINDLLDKVSQLEYENNILKASASQETLSKIAQQLQQQQQQATNSSQPPNNQNQANQPPTSNVHS